MDDIAIISQKLQSLNKKQGELSKSGTMITSELQARRKELKRLMQEVEELGYDPNNLEEEIKRDVEVYRLKVDNYESELKVASEIIIPMLSEISND